MSTRKDNEENLASKKPVVDISAISRQRANSVGDTADFFKRKREQRQDRQPNVQQSSDASPPQELVVFKKSKTTQRTPQKNQQSKSKEEAGAEMDELKDMMRAIMDEMKASRKETAEMREEIRDLRSEMKRREEKWEVEKKELVARVKKLEDTMERQEKRERKNNIIIKGVQFDNKSKEEVRAFLKTNIGVESEADDIHDVVNLKGGMIVKFKNWNKKVEVMGRKQKLKGSRIYIDSDLTANEREIQKDLRELAREEKNKGNIVKVGYQKITINDKIYKWEAIKKDIIPKN